MQGFAPSNIFLFEDFRLHRRGGLFRCGDSGAFVPVAIGSRALDILGVLIERAGEVVLKDEITAAVWPETVVEDSNLTVQVSMLRRVLDRARSNGSCIQTVPGRGYRFVATVTHPAAEARAAPRDVDAQHLDDRQPSYVAAPRLSIVVLPFANLSNDPDQQYFVDGLTEDLTTDLSRIPEMFVISRKTAFTYRNKPVDTKQIGRELGVRYVLEGSVQRSGNRARVASQLIDAERDAHLWAERFDRDIGDLFALQDDITTRIAVALNLELIGAEATRPTEHPDALDYIFRGRATRLKPPTRENRSEQIS
jgi:TolB-like protein